MSWTLTKPGIDIKTEKRGIELMLFLQYLVRNVVCIETVESKCNSLQDSPVNLAKIYHSLPTFTKRIFKAMAYL
jgi:hypothetical protein